MLFCGLSASKSLKPKREDFTWDILPRLLAIRSFTHKAAKRSVGVVACCKSATDYFLIKRHPKCAVRHFAIDNSEHIVLCHRDLFGFKYKQIC